MCNKKVYKKYKNQQKNHEKPDKKWYILQKKSLKSNRFLVKVVTYEKQVKLYVKSLIWLPFLTRFWPKNAQNSYIFYKLVVKKQYKKTENVNAFWNDF